MLHTRLTDRRLSVLGGIGVVLIMAALVISGSSYAGYGGKDVLFVASRGCLVTIVPGHSMQPTGWHAWSTRDKWGLQWWPGIASGSGGAAYSEFVIPLWIPALVLAVPTLFFWRRSRRHRAGYCRKCRYNLTGLTEPRCPECGTEFDPATVPRVVGTGAEDS